MNWSGLIDHLHTNSLVSTDILLAAIELPYVWRRIRAEAGLADDVRLHDLRHSYASHAVMRGESLMITGKLLGHRHTATTERYAHLTDHFLLEAAERVANRILSLLEPGG